MAQFTLLENAESLTWYLVELDLKERYFHSHIGKPTGYPCKVISRREKREGSWQYYHRYIYKTEIALCPTCGNESYSFPEKNPDDYA